MEEAIWLASAACAGLVAGYAATYLPRLRRRDTTYYPRMEEDGHVHIYDTMKGDGRWYCALCGHKKERGS